MRFFLTRARTAAALLACLSLPGVAGLGTPALAQTKKPAAPAAAPAPAAPAPAGAPAAQQGPIKVELKASQPEWTKVCGKDQGNNKEICYTTRDFGTEPNQPFVALAVYDIKGDDQRVVRLLLPPALLLRPGVRISVDKGPQLEGEFQICMPNGCFAETKVKGATIDQLKKGTLLNVAVKNSSNIEVDFTLPLDSFGKAFDGPPIDPKKLAEEQQAMQKQLEDKAQAARQALEAQQKANGAAPAPAAPAPAPAK